MAALRDRPDDLFALVSAASGSLGLAPAFVEKDFWVTELLRAATRAAEAQGATAVFKGGTSLSKGYGLLKRFSEDVDILLVAPQHVGRQARHGILRRICADVGDHLGVPPSHWEVRESETGVKRNVRYRYDQRFSSSNLHNGVLLEMGVRGGDQPRQVRAVSSLIAAHAVRHGVLESEFVEFAPVRTEVLNAERTLVEKLALLHDLASRYPSTGDTLARAARHYYDLHELLGHPPTRHVLHDDPELVGRLGADVGWHSVRHGLAFSPRPAGGYADSPAFDPAHPCQEAAQTGYGQARSLVYGEVPTLEDCMRRVRNARSVL
jgi:hypothetical protein